VPGSQAAREPDIGLAGAQALAEAGAIVVMSGRRKEVLAPEADKIRIKGRRGPKVASAGRFRIRGGQESKADGILSRHGRVDILLNSAGLNTTNRYWKEQTRRVDGWREVIGINLDGSFYTIHAVAAGDACEERRADRQRVLLGRRLPSEIDRCRL